MVLALAFFFLMPEALADSRMEKKTEAAHEISSVQYMACTGCALLFFDDGKKKIETEQVVLRVQEMNCRRCPLAVKKSLVKLEGVSEVLVTLRPPQAYVTYDPSRIKVEQLIAATREAGFPSIEEIP